MTLLVALKGKDGIALAADSRGTFGNPVAVTAQNDSMKKAHTLTNHVGALQAGSGEVGALIIERAQKRLKEKKLDGVTTVANGLREVARDSFNEWFPTVPPIQPPQLVQTGKAARRPDLVFIVAGYEVDPEGKNKPSNPHIYQIASGSDFAPMLHDYGFAVAGVGQYALYLLNRLYEPDRTIAELAALTVYVITETASQDGKVGGPVNVITISPEKGTDVLSNSKVDEIVKTNEKRSRDLRDSFYERTR